jgi:hypothetical protein
VPARPGCVSAMRKVLPSPSPLMIGMWWTVARGLAGLSLSQHGAAVAAGNAEGKDAPSAGDG